MKIYMPPPPWLEHTSGEFDRYQISWNAIALRKNLALLVADNLYVKRRIWNILLTQRMAMVLSKLSDWRISAWFWSQLKIFHVSNHTEELSFNETVCLWMIIYTYIYIYVYSISYLPDECFINFRRRKVPEYFHGLYIYIYILIIIIIIYIYIYTEWIDKIVALEKTTWFHFRLMKTGLLFLLQTIY